MAQRRDALARKGMTTGNDTERVLELIACIARKSAGGDYLYRGERECYPKVSSNLYRQYEEIEAEEFNIEEVQKEILREAQRHTRKTDELEILEELQHYGGNTNFIDFTRDYLIALFFACDGELKKDGRVVLLRKSEEIRPHIIEPKTPENRVIAQKSVFIWQPKGYIEPEDMVTIIVPRDLKLPVLQHLRKRHGISAPTIYNDLHGFIKTHKTHERSYKEFARGLSCTNQGKIEEAICHYSKAIELNPQSPAIYINRGIAYKNSGNLDLAIQDYDRAIELGQQDKAAYNNRGVAYGRNNELDLAIQDFNKAIELDQQDKAPYNNRGIAHSRKDELDLAIQDYDKAIERDPQFKEAYYNRGNTHYKKNELDLAIQDFNRAIELDPRYKEAYYHRGVAWLRQQEWEKAKADLNAAKYMRGIDIAARFQIGYGSVERFEGKFGVKLPEDVAALLR